MWTRCDCVIVMAPSEMTKESKEGQKKEEGTERAKVVCESTT